MSQRAELVRTSIKLALFIAVCMGFTLWLAFTIGNIRLFQGTYQLAATFDDATGLLPDDNVKIAGVVVGKVNSVKIDQGRARVTFEIHDDVAVPASTAAAIRWRNLLGQRYVYLVPPEGAAEASVSEPLGDGDEITETVSVVDLGELFNRLGPIITALDPGQINSFLEAVDGALTGNEDSLRDAIGDLADLTQAIADRDDAISRMVANLDTVAGTIANREDQIRQMLDNLVVLAQTFSSNTGVLDTAITELGDFSDHLGTLLTDNQDNVQGIIDSLQIVVDVVAGNLDDLDVVLENLDDTGAAFFRAGSYGTWLNQIIPCGAIGILPLEESCDATGTNEASAGSSTSLAPAPVSGASAISQLISLGLPAEASR